MRDDLTQIVGVLPVVETTLNRLGVYHFDQVAEWSDADANWVETHLGIAGRVEREHWREQAHELAAVASGKRPHRKKRPS
jgi:predicted flap endonuclease-1-like 5' DNA nuclease